MASPRTKLLPALPPPKSRLERLFHATPDKVRKALGGDTIEHFYREKYALTEQLGQGGFGAVYECERETGNGLEKLATKVSKIYCRSTTYYRRAIKEAAFTTMFDHPNIINLEDTILHYDELLNANISLSLVLESMESDLYNILDSNRFNAKQVENTLYQILSPLKYLHAENIIHRDIKPSNVLINSNGHAKLIDFNLCTIEGQPAIIADDIAALLRLDYFSEEEQKPSIRPQTARTGTRGYHAPEMLMKNKYSTAVDIWGCGIIFLQLLLNMANLDKEHVKAMKDLQVEDELLELISIIKLTATRENLESIQDPKLRKNLNSYAGKMQLNQLIALLRKQFLAQGESVIWIENALDLLEQMLTFNPKNRITAKEALKHRFMAAPCRYFQEDSIPSLSAQLKSAKDVMSDPEVHEWCRDRTRKQPFSQAVARALKSWCAAVRLCELELEPIKDKLLADVYLAEMAKGYPQTYRAIPLLAATKTQPQPPAVAYFDAKRPGQIPSALPVIKPNKGTVKITVRPREELNSPRELPKLRGFGR